jgi:fructokinase
VIEVVSLGEVIVDFLPERTGIPLHESRIFSMQLGGAPANVAVGIARLGRSCALHGAVGADEFGAFLRAELSRQGVSVRGLHVLPGARTAHTFVAVAADGERSFVFFRDDTADLRFDPTHLDMQLIADAAIFHFGSNLLSEPRCEEATERALDKAAASGSLISFDPNIRFHLWDDPARAMAGIKRFIRRASLLKLSDGENALLAPNQPPASAFEHVYAPAGVKALVVTHGAGGATLVTHRTQRTIRPPKVDVVDTTGAGDAFVAGLLTGLLRHSTSNDLTDDLSNMSAEHWRPILELANATAAGVCTKMGATAGLP